MNRRPWPILLLAILQFLSPLIYVSVASFFYDLSFGATVREILTLASTLRKFDLFVLPFLLGGLILSVRKSGYAAVLAGTAYLVVRGVFAFIASNETDPVFPIVFSNALCLVVFATLLRPKTRSVYFNPRLRWWETSPRYVIAFPASLKRVGGNPSKATVQNVAAGGIGLEVAETGFLKGEIVDLEFQHEGETFRLKSKVVWESALAPGKQGLGLQWADGNPSGEFSKIRRLIRALKAKGTPSTHTLPPRLSEVKGWFSKIAG